MILTSLWGCAGSAFTILKKCFRPVYALLPIDFPLMPLNKFWNFVNNLRFSTFWMTSLPKPIPQRLLTPPFRPVYPVWSFSRNLNILTSTAKSAGLRFGKIKARVPENTMEWIGGSAHWRNSVFDGHPKYHMLSLSLGEVRSYNG